MLAPTVDVAWRRNFGDGAAFFLGLSAGIGLIGLFTGLRF